MTPFKTLDLPDDTDDDAQIKQAYLAKVRAFPPDHAPEQFQQIRAAFKLIQDKRKRCAYQLFYTHALTATEVSNYLLAQHNTPPRRVNAKHFRQALLATLHTTLTQSPS